MVINPIDYENNLEHIIFQFIAHQMFTYEIKNIKYTT